MSLFRVLHFSKAAGKGSGSYSSMIPLFNADHCGVRSIIGPQLGRDVLDSTLDGFLGDLQLIRDLRVGIPSGDQAQHADLCRSWCRSASPTVGGKRAALCCRATSTRRFAGDRPAGKEEAETAEVQGLQVHSRRYPSQVEVHYKVVVPPILALPKSFQRRWRFSEKIVGC